MISCAINIGTSKFFKGYNNIALALWAGAILLSLKNSLLLINTKLHSKLCYYFY